FAGPLFGGDFSGVGSTVREAVGGSDSLTAEGRTAAIPFSDGPRGAPAIPPPPGPWTAGPPAADPSGALLAAVAATFLGGPGQRGGPGVQVDTPTITEPRRDGAVVSPADVHMETAPFSDPNPNAYHQASDWEIWTVTPLQRVGGAGHVRGRIGPR